MSYNETYCVEGRAERRRGVPESVDGGGEVVGMVCVHRHIFFITPVRVSPERQIALPPTMSPAPFMSSARPKSARDVTSREVSRCYVALTSHQQSAGARSAAVDHACRISTEF